ncbi:MAG: hypothetical protein AAF828_01265 [Bacteroidota bacterium]
MSQGVRQFQRYCTKVANHDKNATAALKGMQQIVASEMPAKYRIPYEVETTQVPTASGSAKHYRGLWYELVQHLTDLSFLTEKQFVAFHQNRKHVQDQIAYHAPVVDAVVAYLQQEKDWPQLERILPSSSTTINHYWTEQHLADIVDRIGRYTALDGSLPPPQEYVVGSGCCYGRAMAFRIRTLQAGKQRIKEVRIFQQEHIGLLTNLLQELRGRSPRERIVFERQIDQIVVGQSLPPEVWTLTGDIDLLYAAYQDRKTHINRKKIWIYYQQYPTKTRWETPDIEKWAQKSKRKSRRMAGEINISSAGNPLGIRLLQIKLWQSSFYVGAIDGLWGPVSHNALVALLEREYEFTEENKRRFWLLNPQNIRQTLLRYQAAGTTTYLVNLASVFTLLNQYQASKGADMNTTGSPGDIDNDLAFYTEVKKEAQVEDFMMDRRILEEQIEEDLYPDATRKPERRVAYPRRSFLAGLWHSIKKIGRWIKRAFQKVLGPIFSFVKYMLQRIRRGIQLFFTGFKYLSIFLLGRPIITTGLTRSQPVRPVPYVTKFSLDFDAVNVLPSDGRQKDLVAHADHIAEMKNSMFYFIDVVTWVIKRIGRLMQPGGWVWLGLTILKEIGNLALEFLGVPIQV